jgi:hypothetical protein
MASLWSLASYCHSASLSVVPNTKNERAAIVEKPLAQKPRNTSLPLPSQLVFLFEFHSLSTAMQKHIHERKSSQCHQCSFLMNNPRSVHGVWCGRTRLWDLPAMGRTKHCRLLQEKRNTRISRTKSQPARRFEKLTPVCLVAELSQLLLGLVVNLRALLGIDELSSCGLLALVVCSTLNFSSLLKSILS